jgi:hypothetical protein
MEGSGLEGALEEYVGSEDFGVLGDDSTDDDGPAITSDNGSFVLRGQGRGAGIASRNITTGAASSTPRVDRSSVRDATAAVVGK